MYLTGRAAITDSAQRHGTEWAEWWMLDAV